MVDKNDLAKCLKTGHIFDKKEPPKKNFEKLLKFVCISLDNFITYNKAPTNKTFYIEY